MTQHPFRLLFISVTVAGLFCLSRGVLAQSSSNSAAPTAELAELPPAPLPQTGNATPDRQNPSAAAESQRDRAARELRQEEHQRILGVIPNFNTTDIHNAAPLSPKQKFQLMFRSIADPFEFVAAGAVAGFGQATDNHSGYGQGAAGYAKRYGAAYADSADGAFWGNAILPILFHQDPRYFRRGSGPFWSRFKYALLTTVWTKNDNGTWGPNYSNVLGNFISGGISNAYYPSEDRGLGLTLEGATIVTAEGAVGSLGVEFWPDISRKLFNRREKHPAAPAPK